jgi:hypothetical protein
MIHFCAGGFGPLCAWCDQFDKDGGEPMGPNHWWCAYPNRRSRTFDVMRQVLAPSVSDDLVWKITIFTAPPRRCAAGDSLSPCAAGELPCAAGKWGRSRALWFVTALQVYYLCESLCAANGEGMSAEALLKYSAPSTSTRWRFLPSATVARWLPPNATLCRVCSEAIRSTSRCRTTLQVPSDYESDSDHAAAEARFMMIMYRRTSDYESDSEM